MKKTSVPDTIKIRCVCVWIASFLLALACSYYVNQNIEKEAKLRAYYTAELTTSRVEAQLRKYLEVSDFLKNTVESGYEISGADYAVWAQRIPNNSKVIKAIELAKDGVVNEIYPLEGNSDAMGIDMLNNPARKFEANLAMLSRQYTMAGPYPLAQGGMGALLFDPIYTVGADGSRHFWGFSILVIDWNKFLEEIGLHRLSDADFVYQLRKGEESYSDYTVIAKSDSVMPDDAVKVAFDVPNDKWYLEIAPQNGWVSRSQKSLGFFLSVITAFFITVIFYQTQLKRYKEKLYAEKIQRSAEEAKLANEAKTRFLFNMSHDIRTPMNAIIGFAHLLERSIGDERKCRDYLGKIQSSSQLLLTIINQVLEMARIESGKTMLNTEAVNIREIVASLNTVFEAEIEAKELIYKCDINIEHEHIVCDKTKLEEIILNIVSNSIKYTEPRGKVMLTIAEQQPAEPAKASYVLTVEDTGIGMAEDYLPHIFEEFSREHTTTETKVVGTGLGLPIVKSLIELMQGSVQVESTLGVGTKFTVQLTFALADAGQLLAEQEYEQIALAEKLKGKKVLLAEDNALNAEIASVILTEAGFVVKHVENGAECVAELRKMPIGTYDVILMDVQMPQMDGYAATKAIRDLQDARAKIPVIAMTANVYEEDKQKALAAGMTGFLAKPLDIKKMMLVLSEQLGGEKNK